VLYHVGISVILCQYGEGFLLVLWNAPWSLRWISIGLKNFCCMRLLCGNDGYRFGCRSNSSSIAPRLNKPRLDFWIWIVYFVMMIRHILRTMRHIQFHLANPKTSLPLRWETCVVKMLALGSLLIASANLPRSCGQLVVWRWSLSRWGPVFDARPWKNAQ
jgi:hypothetical protein